MQKLCSRTSASRARPAPGVSHLAVKQANGVEKVAVQGMRTAAYTLRGHHYPALVGGVLPFPSKTAPRKG